jgi:3-hydroxyacyl-[acyl-carrier-protein] dehydratase
VRNIKYGNFVEPGRCLNVSVELVERDGERASFKGKGEVEGQSTVSARLVLASYNLKDRRPGLSGADARLVQHLRERFAWLTAGLALAGAATEERG